MIATESKQATKLCRQCGFANLSVAKFCIECGTRFGIPGNEDIVDQRKGRSSTRTVTPASPQVDPASAVQRLLSMQSREEATARLKAAIQSNRALLKSLGVQIPKATNPLIVSLMESLKALPNTQTSARIAIVTALGRTGDPSVLPPMLLVSGTTMREVRKAVAIALGCIRHPLSAYLLLPMLKDGSSRVRQAALHSLLQISQPCTVESMLASCLCSKALRILMMDTLHAVSANRRFEFFKLMKASKVNHESGLKTVADWLRYEFQNESSNRRVPAVTLNPSSSMAMADSQRRSLQSNSAPVAQKESSSSDVLMDSSDSCDVIAYVPPQPPEPGTSRPAPRQHQPQATSTKSFESDVFSWNQNATSPAGTSNRNDDRSAATTQKHNERSQDSGDNDDVYQLDDRLSDGDDSSAADLEFFDAMTKAFFEESEETEDHGNLEVAASGSQTSVSRNGLLEVPESTNRQRRPAQAPSKFSGRDSGKVAAAALTSSQLTEASSGTPAFDLTASSPLIHAFTSHPSDFAAHSSNVNSSASPAAVTLTDEFSDHAAPRAPITSLRDDDLDSGENRDEQTAQKAELQAKAFARLSTARKVAFNVLLKDAEQLPTKIPRQIKKLASALYAVPSTNVEEIAKKLRDLAASGSPGALTTLAAFGKKPAKAIREACGDALGNIRHPGSAVLLLKLLADKSGTVTEAVVKSLVRLDLAQTRPVLLAAGLCGTSLRSIVTGGMETTDIDNKVEWEQYLLDVAEGDDTDAAAFAVSLLARIAGEARIEIFQSLARNPAPVLRAAAIEALARTQAKRAISLINDGLEDSDPGVRAQAALSVAVMYSPRSVELLQKLIFDKNLNVRRNAAQSMSRIDESGLAKTLAKALDQETDSTTVEFLLAALARNGEDNSLPVLQRYVEDRSCEFREQAVKALRKLRIPASIPIFRCLLNDHAAGLRRQGVEQLVVLKSETELPRIREILKKDPDESVRAACAKALGEFGDDSSLTLLEEALGDHPAVRIQAVIALGRLGQASAGPVLLGLLRDSHAEIRYQSVKALGQLKLTDSMEFIEPLLDDTDELVRRGAEQTLIELGMSAGNRRARQWKRRVAVAAGWIAPSSLAALLPGGAKTLLTVVVLLASTAGMFAFKSILVAAGGEHFDIEEPISMSIDAKGNHMLVVRQYGVCEVWDLKTGQLSCRQSLPGRVTGGLFADDSRVLINQDGKFAAYAFPGSELKEQGQAFDLPERLTHTVIHRKTQTLFVAYLKENLSYLASYDLKSMKKTSDRRLPKILGGHISVSPDGHFVASMSGSTVVVFDLVNNQAGEFSFSDLTGGAQSGEVLSMSFSDDMKYLAISQSAYGIAVIDLESTSVKSTLKPKDSFGYSFVRFAPGSHNLIAVSSSGKVVVNTNEFSNTSDFAIEGCRSAIDMFSVSDDNRQVAVGSTEEQDIFVGDSGMMKMSHHLDPVDE